MLWNRSFEIRSCIEILANDINVDTTYQHMLYVQITKVNCIPVHIGGSSSFRRQESVKYV